MAVLHWPQMNADEHRWDIGIGYFSSRYMSSSSVLISGQINMTPCRQILSEPTDGASNMALDEALLESAAAAGANVRPTLRIYGWPRPTLSLGYFQRAADREMHEASGECDLVRRPSGGGAILHDRELTYALVLPEIVATTRPATQWSSCIRLRPSLALPSR